MFKRLVSAFLCFFFALQEAGLAQVAGRAALPVTFASSPSTDTFRPVHLRAVSYASAASSFRVLIDKGDVSLQAERSGEYDRVLTYFLIGLALPEDAFWVNLRPDSPAQMIDDSLALTDLGRVLLEADLQLKKDTAARTSPQTREGKEYWDRLYRKAEELFGSQDFQIPTLARPWIVPGEIIMRDDGGSAYVYKATLKVMLEQDHLKGSRAYDFRDDRLRQLNEYSGTLMRELIIPALTRDVNSAKRYAQLRQAYYSLVLAAWFREKFRGASGTYAQRIGSRDLRGLSSARPWNREDYFRAYKASFEKGEYSVRENANGRERSYVSGGVAFGLLSGGETGRGIKGASEAGMMRAREGNFSSPGFTEALSVSGVDSLAITPDNGWQAQRDGGFRLFDRGGGVDRVLANIDRNKFPMAAVHPVEAYANAFKGFSQRARGVLGIGRTALALELESGNVLKISLADPFANRAYNPGFDTTLVEQGTRRTSTGATIHYIIQPKLEMTATTADILAFKNRVRPFRFEDIAPDQIGYNRATGRWELADTGAVVAPAAGEYAPVVEGTSDAAVFSQGDQQTIADRLTGFIRERLQRYRDQTDISAEYGTDWENWQTIRVNGYGELVFKQSNLYPSRMGYENEVHEMSVTARNIPGEELLVDGVLLLSLPGLAAFKYGVRGESDGFRITQASEPAREADLAQVLRTLEREGIATADIGLEDIGIVEKRGVKTPVLVNLSKVFYTGRKIDAQTQRDGGRELARYKAGIEEGIGDGIILQIGQPNSVGEQYSHIGRGLDGNNTRGLSSAARRALVIVMLGNKAARVIDLGAGAGKACSDMYMMAREFGAKIAIELAGMVAVAPRLLFRGAWRDIRGPADEKGYERGKPVPLEFALGLTAGGRPVFEPLAEPFIRREYIGDFMDARVRPEGSFDFIYDSFGAVFYGARDKGLGAALDKVFSLMARESVLLIDSLSIQSMDELVKNGLPEGYAGFVSAADSSLMVIDRESARYRKISQYLGNAALRAPNVYLLNDLNGVLDILQGAPADLSSNGKLDREVVNLVHDAAQELSKRGGGIEKGRELLRYSESFPGFNTQINRLGNGTLVTGILANVRLVTRARDGGAMREKMELKRAAAEAAAVYSPSEIGNCVDATRHIAAALADSGIPFQERQVNVPFDFRETGTGAATTTHVILEARAGTEAVVVDTQLRQFKENSHFDAPWEFVDRYVYDAAEYYSKVNAYSDSLCLERIRAVSLPDGGMRGKYAEHYRGVGGFEYAMFWLYGDPQTRAYELESGTSEASLFRILTDMSATPVSPSESPELLSQLVGLDAELQETLESPGFSAFRRKYYPETQRDGGTVTVTRGKGFTVEMEASAAIRDELGRLARAVTTEYDQDAEFAEDMGLIIGTLENGTYRITRLARVTEFEPDSKPEYLLPSKDGLVRVIDANVREGEKVLGAYHNHSYMRLLSGQTPGPSSPDLLGLADVLEVPGRQDRIAQDLLGIVLEPEIHDMPIDRVASFHPRDSRVLVHSWVTHATGGRENYSTSRAESNPYLDSLGSRDGGKQSDLGGIDLRSIRAQMRASGGGLERFAGSSAAALDLEREWSRIEKMRDGGLKPSVQRLGEFAAACSVQDALPRYADGLLGCIAAVLRAEETKAEPAESRLRELLSALEQG